MEQILFIREGIISFYKSYERYINFALKFLVGFIIFNFISKIDRPNADILKSFPQMSTLVIRLGLGFLFAALPVTPAYLLVIAYIALQTSAILEISAIITLVLICVLVFYVRLAPTESFLIIMTVLAFYIRLPYFVPMFAGLYLGLSTIIPVTVGVFIWHIIPVILSLLTTSKTAGYDLTEIPNTLLVLYVEALGGLGTSNQWIFYAFIFAMMIIIVNVVSHLSIDYSKDIAISLGAVVAIISFVIAVLITDMDIGIMGIIFFTLLSAVALLILRYFDSILDYSRVEKVEFEDEDNYYYVKIVPKVLMIKRNRTVKRIRPTHEDFDDEYEV